MCTASTSPTLVVMMESRDTSILTAIALTIPTPVTADGAQLALRTTGEVKASSALLATCGPIPQTIVFHTTITLMTTKEGCLFRAIAKFANLRADRKASPAAQSTTIMLQATIDSTTSTCQILPALAIVLNTSQLTATSITTMHSTATGSLPALLATIPQVATTAGSTLTVLTTQLVAQASIQPAPTTTIVSSAFKVNALPAITLLAPHGLIATL